MHLNHADYNRLKPFQGTIGVGSNEYPVYPASFGGYINADWVEFRLAEAYYMLADWGREFMGERRRRTDLIRFGKYGQP